MALTQITRANWFTKGIPNLKNILDSNSGTVKVTTSYSKNTNVPIIVVEQDSNPDRVYLNGGSLEVTYNIYCINTTDLKTDTLTQEIYGLLYNDTTLIPYNMECQRNSIRVLNASPITKTDKKLLKVKRIVVDYVVR